MKTALRSAALAALALTAASVRADTAEETANRQLAEAFYDAVFNAKDFAAASELVSPYFVQHTARIADGSRGLREHVAYLRRAEPESRREIKRLMTDGDTVIIQAHYIPEPGARGAVVGDILRFENGLIVEQWGIVHPITETPHPDNKNDVF